MKLFNYVKLLIQFIELVDINYSSNDIYASINHSANYTLTGYS